MKFWLFAVVLLALSSVSSTIAFDVNTEEYVTGLRGLGNEKTLSISSIAIHDAVDAGGGGSIIKNKGKHSLPLHSQRMHVIVRGSYSRTNFSGSANRNDNPTSVHRGPKMV